MIVAGFGFRQGAQQASLQAALTLAQKGLPQVMALAAPDDKVSALSSLAEILGLPLLSISAEALVKAAPTSFSAASFAARGTGSVAEAAALAGAGEGAALFSPRHISPDRMATCAIAGTILQGNHE